MINLFDLSINMSGNRLLNDKANHDGSASGRNGFNAIRKAIDPVEVLRDDVPLTCELRKNSVKKQDQTSMKMLIAQEMSRDMENKRKSPNVIARLMGLDDPMPAAPAATPSKRNTHDAVSCRSLSGARTLQDRHLPQVGYSGRLKSGEFQTYGLDNKDYRDVQERLQGAARSNGLGNQLLQNGRLDEGLYEKRMSLVREKFIEAKRLARDENLLESKEFHDALEILNSNRELFLKFLEEPNSLLAKHLKEADLVCAPTQTKRITVLKPSKIVEAKPENQVKQLKDDSGWEMPNTPWSSNVVHHIKTEKLSQPTRIVILKPSPKKHSEMMDPTTPVGSSPEPQERRVYCGGVKAGDQVDSREVAKQITQQMRENLSRRHRRDESLLSCVFSNGYVGDDSSFNGSEGYAEEVDNCISDSEIPSSWDYTSNRHGSPNSHSSLSRDSYSPESSVIREAKKRLSERCALVATKGDYQEQLQERSFSTLGEMLAVCDLKREHRNDVRPLGSRSCGREEDFRMQSACLSVGRTKDENGADESSSQLARSKSVPTSSSFDNLSLNGDDTCPWVGKPTTSKGIPKTKSGKTSFKGRVSSLFFLKNKKGGSEKSASSVQANSNDVLPIIDTDITKKKQDDSGLVHEPFPGENLPGNLKAASGGSSLTMLNNKQDEIRTTAKMAAHDEPRLSSENQERIPEKFGENQDHPSPTSILDAPFVDDLNNAATSSSKAESANNPQILSRSTPIESIARTLSWDDSCLEASSPSPFKLSIAFSKAGEQETEYVLFAQNLLSVSGLYKNRPSSVFDGWQSPDAPLDLKLLDKILDTSNKVAESRERRSSQRLLFDCVNLVLLEIGHAAEMSAYRCTPARDGLGDGTGCVWDLVSKRVSGDVKLAADEAKTDGDVVERMVEKEIAGSEWSEFLELEMVAMSKEIGMQVLDDLFGEALVELIAN